MAIVEMREVELTQEIRELTSVDCGVTVECDTDYDLAGDFLNELKKAEKKANEYWKLVVQSAHETHKTLKAKQNEMVEPIAAAKKAIGAEMGRYQDRLEVERREEERVAREIERASAKREQEEYAKNLREMGHDEAAAAVVKHEPEIATVIESYAPKVDGTTRRKTWHFEITDPELVPPAYMMIDEKLIGQVGRSKKENASIPGVRFYSKTNVS